MIRALAPRQILAVIVGVICAVSAAAPVAATPPTPSSGALWIQGELEYRWREGNEPPAWLRGAIHAAARDASESTRARTPSFSYGDAGTGWVSYTGNIPTRYAVAYATRNVPQSFGIRLRPHGYVLDWGKLRWCQFFDSPPNGCYDAEMITLHEFGHVLTLGHIDESTVTNWLDTVMHEAPKTRAKQGWNAHEYGRCDAARLQLRYAAASPDTPISTCLSLATGLTLWVSPAPPVGYGTSVSLIANLRVATDSRADSLSGDPLSNRDVWLQRRAIGATAWTDYGQMSGQGEAAGRYSKSLYVTAPYEYRARFVAGNEGLDGSSSSVVRVSVADRCGTSRFIGSVNAPTC